MGYSLYFNRTFAYEIYYYGLYFYEIPSKPHSSTPFWRKIIFSSKYCEGDPPSNFLEVCINSATIHCYNQFQILARHFCQKKFLLQVSNYGFCQLTSTIVRVPCSKMVLMASTPIDRHSPAYFF
jgi:hypothetical protein